MSNLERCLSKRPSPARPFGTLPTLPGLFGKKVYVGRSRLFNFDWALSLNYSNLIINFWAYYFSQSPFELCLLELCPYRPSLFELCLFQLCMFELWFCSNFPSVRTLFFRNFPLLNLFFTSNKRITKSFPIIALRWHVPCMKGFSGSVIWVAPFFSSTITSASCLSRSLRIR